MFVFALQHKDNKPLSNYRNIKSQGDFNCLNLFLRQVYLLFFPYKYKK
ncbi:hypothetical protein HMPREF6745_2980 [Prevotella sp. oral taxon 472 str. F0295]|nr:hypothetical protein HMPREF6745_2980 [Prevotella sp. oral taxon 472 str. F0295]